MNKFMNESIQYWNRLCADETSQYFTVEQNDEKMNYKPNMDDVLKIVKIPQMSGNDWFRKSLKTINIFFQN